MSLVEILILCLIGAFVTVFWLALIRASMRRRRCCGTNRCKAGTPAEDASAAEGKDG